MEQKSNNIVDIHYQQTGEARLEQLSKVYERMTRK